MLPLNQSGNTDAELKQETELQTAERQQLASCSEKGAGEGPAAQLFSNSLAQDPELVADFLLETGEHLQTIEAQALTLESDPANEEAIHAMFRAFHTMKGLAGFLGFEAVHEIAHEVETILERARCGTLAVSPPVIDAILESSDYLRAWMRHIESALGGSVEPAPEPAQAICERIRKFSSFDSANDAPVAASLAKLSASLEDCAEDQLSDTTPSESRPSGMTGVAKPGGSELRAIKVDTAKLDYLVEMVGEMVIAQSLIQHDPELVQLKTPRLLRNISQATRITSEVQKTAMAMRMIPIGQLFRRMRRVVRDVSRKAGKRAELAISGAETELDRTIIEELADPLIHMLRNAIDHGIESPEERIALGKPETARISLRAAHQGGNILIEVADDGRGLDREKILAKARQRGLIKHEDPVVDSEIFALIFEPGFSTAERISEISGRGVGMDIVKKQVQKMRGRIEIQSTPGHGTRFSIKLPLTLAIIDGLVVGVGEERYIIPIFAVQEVLRLAENALSTLPNGAEMALIRGALVPILRLHRRFGIQPRSETVSDGILVICESEGKRLALLVDELAGKQEVVIKSLGRTFKDVQGVAGGAILGDGRVGLILDIDGLMGSGNPIADTCGDQEFRRSLHLAGSSLPQPSLIPVAQ
jgi:two-component system chemotaxis sensor kinase CheA